MAARTLQPTTPVIGGVAVTAASGVTTSSDTMTISATTAQSILNLKDFVLRLDNSANSTTAHVITLAASDYYTGLSIGSKAISVASGANIVVGGAGFESSRFEKQAETLVFTHTSGAANLTWEAYMLPKLR